MKAYSTAQLRNVGLFSHGGAGKNSLAEAMLFAAKATNRIGRVDEGNTVTDYDPDEQKRRISVQLAVAPIEWGECKINVIDVPGYAEFSGEVKAGMAVSDAAVLLLDASAGVEVGTEQAWKWAGERGIARIVFINKMERENADFNMAMQSAQTVLGKKCTAMQIPIGSQQNFRGIIDLLTMKAFIYQLGNTSGTFTEEDIPAELLADAQSRREALIEQIAESDDDLTMKYLEGEELPPAEIVTGLKAGLKSGNLNPVLCGSGAANVGVTQLLDAITDYGPSPIDAGPVKATNPVNGQEVTLQPNDNAPLAGLVFKTVRDQFGKMTLVRVFSGTLRSDSQVLNSTRNVQERIGQVYFVRGKEQIPTQQLVAGDIGAVVKLADTRTGDTLCAPGQPVVLPTIDFPEPVFSASISPKTKADLDKMGQALA